MPKPKAAALVRLVQRILNRRSPATPTADCDGEHEGVEVRHIHINAEDPISAIFAITDVLHTAASALATGMAEVIARRDGVTVDAAFHALNERVSDAGVRLAGGLEGPVGEAALAAIGTAVAAVEAYREALGVRGLGTREANPSAHVSTSGKGVMSGRRVNH